MKKLSKLQQRSQIIIYIYQAELLEVKLDSTRAFEEGDYNEYQIKVIESISTNYESFKKLVQKFIKGTWTWERLAPLERAILIFGAFELNIADRALVINELVTIAQGFIPGESYKFINAILDKIGDYYAGIKGN